MGSYTGTVPTFLAGELVDADKLVEITNFMTAATDVWTAWVPTTANITLGNGVIVARYRRLGKTIDIRLKFTLGSTSAMGSDPSFSLPVAPIASVTNFEPLADGYLIDTGSGSRIGQGLYFGGVMRITAYGTTGIQAGITSTFPHIWASTDLIVVTGSYEAA